LRIAVRRRALLGLAAQLMAAGAAGSAAVDEHLEYRDGCLSWPGGAARAAIGRAGVSANKREGDGATPAGTFPLISAFYRADRLPAPVSRLPLRVLSPSDAWVDDPTDRNYNRLVPLPYSGHAEPMWLDDAVYDLLVVIGYNMEPVIAGAGSAIFMHVARHDFSPTTGCIAVAKDVLIGLMPRLGPSSTITIKV
jgi:L,D-peptidoglycan transpeptidase YkuD (ErfK/YbiS/YcfS/YnhG family)